MILHHSKNEFNELVALTSKFKGLRAADIERDYDIVLILKRLMNSAFKDSLIFKGGTSLSKCYPDTINRFSEDIDLSLINSINKSNKFMESNLKRVESHLIGDFNYEIIPEERSQLSKSTYIWREDFNKRIKLEIGVNIIDTDYELKPLNTYIYDFLHFNEMKDLILKYDLNPINVETMSIRQTFIDKVFAIKRHVITNQITNKMRHLYDVSRLLVHEEIVDLLKDKIKLKEVVVKTKMNDATYLLKRKVQAGYKPAQKYNLRDWMSSLDTGDNNRSYIRMLNNLVHDDYAGDFNQAIKGLEMIAKHLEQINE